MCVIAIASSHLQPIGETGWPVTHHNSESYNDNWAEVQNQLASIKERIDQFQIHDENFSFYEHQRFTLREVARALEGLREYLGIAD